MYKIQFIKKHSCFLLFTNIFKKTGLSCKPVLYWEKMRNTFYILFYTEHGE